MAGEGSVILELPDYYEDAGSDQMIGLTSPSCSSDELTIIDCEFNMASRILTVTYETSDGDDTEDE